MSVLNKVEKVWMERLEKAVKKPKAEKPFMDLKDIGKVNHDTYYGDSTRNLMQQIKRKSFRVKPEDQEKIVNGRNVWLLNALSRRGDTDKGIISKALANDKGLGYQTPFLHNSGEHNSGRNKAAEAKTEMYNNFINQLVEKHGESRESVIQKLLHGPSHDVQRHVAKHVLNGEELLNHISDREHPLQAGAAAGVLKNPNFGPSHQDEILGHGNPEQVKALIENKDLEPHQYELLFNNPNAEVKDAAIRKVSHMYGGQAPNLPASTIVRAMREHPDQETQANLFKLYRGRHPEVNQAGWQMMPENKDIAGRIIGSYHDHEHPISPEGYQSLLQHHGNDPEFVREMARHEDQLPTDMVRGILQNPQYDDKTKAAWLKHDQLTADDLRPFSQSNDYDAVRRALDHPNTDSDIVQNAHNKARSIAGTGDSGWEQRRWREIQDKALAHPQAPADLAGNIGMMSEAAQIQAARNASNLTDDAKAKLAGSQHQSVRERMASREDLSPELHAQLRGDKAAAVRKAYYGGKARQGTMTPEDWMAGVSDKAGTIRENLLQNRNMPEDAVRKAFAHKDEGTRNLALQHPNVPADLINQAAADKNPKVRMTAWRSGKLSPESAMGVYNGLGTENERREFLMHSSENGGRGTRRSEERKIAVPSEAIEDALARGHGPDVAKYATHSLNPDQITRTYNQLKGTKDYSIGSARDKMVENAHAVQPELLDQILAHRKAHMASNVTPHDDSDESLTPLSTVLQRPELADQHLEEIARTPEDQKHAIDYQSWNALAQNPKTAHLPNVVNFLKGNRGSYRKFIEHNPNVNEQHLRDAWGSDDPGAREQVIKHAAVPLDIVRSAMKDPHEGIREHAQEQVAMHMPDEYNATLPDAHTVDVHPAVEKLKHLKGLISDLPERTVAKRDLKTKLGIQEVPKEVLDPKGNITPESVDTAVKNLPKTRYNISYRHWQGAQMHDKTKPQLVMQMNLTNEQVDHLKKTGLYDTFRKIHDMSFRSGHPVEKHTLGWSRIDTQHPGHLHIDEVQSDLGQGTIRQILKEKESGRMSEGDADKYVKDLKEINKYLAGGHKTINHAILSAVHQTARDRGVPAVKQTGHVAGHGELTEDKVPAQKEIKSTSMDTLQDQAKQSGQQVTPGGKDLPVHMQQTYEEFPKAMGYAEKPKKEVMPETKSPEPTVNYRKMTKSMVQAAAAIAFLKKSGFTGGWASSRPDRPKPAGDMLPSGDRTGKSPTVHVRADTMTHMNYDTSEEHAPKDLKKTEQGESSLHPMGDTKDPTGSIRASEAGNLQDAVDTLEKADKPKKSGNLRRMIEQAKALSKSPEGEQPRDEKGQFIAWDEAAAAAHEATPDDYDPYADEEIWGKPDPKLKKAAAGLSRLAQTIKEQAEGQIREGGHAMNTRFPATARPENLYSSYKQNPHNPIASVLKYGIHRIENADRYKTPESAVAADNEFMKARDHAMTLARIPGYKRGGQHSIEELHNILVKAPHLIDGLIQHQNAIHAHLKGTNKTKMIDGEPHVALVRGLGTGSRQKDPMLASYADTHEQTLGNRIKNMHNHWVPLKNVWYSYDHGPKESHSNKYFPAQDEFLVSPHDLKTAMSTDVKKLVPRKPKDPGNAKPATRMPTMPAAASDPTEKGGP